MEGGKEGNITPYSQEKGGKEYRKFVLLMRSPCCSGHCANNGEVQLYSTIIITLFKHH